MSHRSTLVSPANVAALAASIRGRFPHMSPGDRAVWAQALTTGQLGFDRYEYDVALGGCGANDVEDDHELKPMWAQLCKKRIDVVGWRDDQPTIIEVKPYAGFSAFGQVLGYGWLWQAEARSLEPASLLVVCSRLDPDLGAFFCHHGVSVLVVPER